MYSTKINKRILGALRSGACMGQLKQKHICHRLGTLALEIYFTKF